MCITLTLPRLAQAMHHAHCCHASNYDKMHGSPLELPDLCTCTPGHCTSRHWLVGPQYTEAWRFCSDQTLGIFSFFVAWRCLVSKSSHPNNHIWIRLCFVIFGIPKMLDLQPLHTIAIRITVSCGHDRWWELLKVVEINISSHHYDLEWLATPGTCTTPSQSAAGPGTWTTPALCLSASLFGSLTLVLLLAGARLFQHCLLRTRVLRLRTFVVDTIWVDFGFLFL